MECILHSYHHNSSQVLTATDDFPKSYKFEEIPDGLLNMGHADWLTSATAACVAVSLPAWALLFQRCPSEIRSPYF